MVLFILGAISNMTIFQVNKRRGHKFLMSGMLFGFCMARIVSCILRIVWATRPTNIRLGIAAQVFVAAGIVLIFVINIIFAQRITRAAHPHSGWHPAFSRFFIAIYVLVVVSLIMLIISVVQSFYTLNNNTRRIDRDIQLYGQTLFAVVSFLPIPVVVGGLIVPRKTRIEKFGSGRWRSKVYILLAASFLLCLGATFRVGTSYKKLRPQNNPAWYHHKACFYIFNFTVEIITVYLYILVRVDKRFHVPDGSRGTGDYSGRNLQEAHDKEREGGMLSRINTEGDIFDDAPEDEGEGKNRRNSGDEEKAVGFNTTREGKIGNLRNEDEAVGVGNAK